MCVAIHSRLCVWIEWFNYKWHKRSLSSDCKSIINLYNSLLHSRHGHVSSLRFCVWKKEEKKRKTIWIHLFAPCVCETETETKTKTNGDWRMLTRKKKQFHSAHETKTVAESAVDWRSDRIKISLYPISILDSLLGNLSITLLLSLTKQSERNVKSTHRVRGAHTQKRTPRQIPQWINWLMCMES